MAMVLKKETDWHMILNLHTLNKLAIKYKFPILLIDNLLDDIHSDKFFPKMDLH